MLLTWTLRGYHRDTFKLVPLNPPLNGFEELFDDPLDNSYNWLYVTMEGDGDIDLAARSDTYYVYFRKAYTKEFILADININPEFWYVRDHNPGINPDGTYNLTAPELVIELDVHTGAFDQLLLRYIGRELVTVNAMLPVEGAYAVQDINIYLNKATANILQAQEKGTCTTENSYNNNHQGCCEEGTGSWADNVCSGGTSSWEPDSTDSVLSYVFDFNNTANQVTAAEGSEYTIIGEYETPDAANTTIRPTEDFTLDFTSPLINPVEMTLTGGFGGSSSVPTTSTHIALLNLQANAVEDTGVGVDQIHLQPIVELYGRLQPTTSILFLSDSSGHELGLCTNTIYTNKVDCEAFGNFWTASPLWDTFTPENFNIIIATEAAGLFIDRRSISDFDSPTNAITLNSDLDGGIAGITYKLYIYQEDFLWADIASYWPYHTIYQGGAQIEHVALDIGIAADDYLRPYDFIRYGFFVTASDFATNFLGEEDFTTPEEIFNALGKPLLNYDPSVFNVPGITARWTKLSAATDQLADTILPDPTTGWHNNSVIVDGYCDDNVSLNRLDCCEENSGTWDQATAECSGGWTSGWDYEDLQVRIEFVDSITGAPPATLEYKIDDASWTEVTAQFFTVPSTATPTYYNIDLYRGEHTLYARAKSVLDVEGPIVAVPYKWDSEEPTWDVQNLPNPISEVSGFNNILFTWTAGTIEDLISIHSTEPDFGQGTSSGGGVLKIWRSNNTYCEHDGNDDFCEEIAQINNSVTSYIDYIPVDVMANITSGTGGTLIYYYASPIDIAGNASSNKQQLSNGIVPTLLVPADVEGALQVVKDLYHGTSYCSNPELSDKEACEGSFEVWTNLKKDYYYESKYGIRVPVQAATIRTTQINDIKRFIDVEYKTDQLNEDSWTPIFQDQPLTWLGTQITQGKAEHAGLNVDGVQSYNDFDNNINSGGYPGGVCSEPEYVDLATCEGASAVWHTNHYYISITNGEEITISNDPSGFGTLEPVNPRDLGFLDSPQTTLALAYDTIDYCSNLTDTEKNPCEAAGGIWHVSVGRIVHYVKLNSIQVISPFIISIMPIDFFTIKKAYYGSDLSVQDYVTNVIGAHDIYGSFDTFVGLGFYLAPNSIFNLEFNPIDVNGDLPYAWRVQLEGDGDQGIEAIYPNNNDGILEPYCVGEPDYSEAECTENDEIWHDFEIHKDDVSFDSIIAADLIVGGVLRLETGLSIWSGEFDGNQPSGSGIVMDQSGLRMFDAVGDETVNIKAGAIEENGGYLKLGKGSNFLEYDPLTGILLISGSITVDGPEEGGWGDLDTSWVGVWDETGECTDNGGTCSYVGSNVPYDQCCGDGSGGIDSACNDCYWTPNKTIASEHCSDTQFTEQATCEGEPNCNGGPDPCVWYPDSVAYEPGNLVSWPSLETGNIYIWYAATDFTQSISPGNPLLNSDLYWADAITDGYHVNDWPRPGQSQYHADSGLPDGGWAQYATSGDSIIPEDGADATSVSILLSATHFVFNDSFTTGTPQWISIEIDAQNLTPSPSASVTAHGILRRTIKYTHIGSSDQTAPIVGFCSDPQFGTDEDECLCGVGGVWSGSECTGGSLTVHTWTAYADLKNGGAYLSVITNVESEQIEFEVCTTDAQWITQETCEDAGETWGWDASHVTVSCSVNQYTTQETCEAAGATWQNTDPMALQYKDLPAGIYDIFVTFELAYPMTLYETIDGSAEYSVGTENIYVLEEDVRLGLTRSDDFVQLGFPFERVDLRYDIATHSDFQSILTVIEGSDAYEIGLSNQTYIFNFDQDNNPDGIPTDGLSTIYLFRGAVQYTYDPAVTPAPNTFSLKDKDGEILTNTDVFASDNSNRLAIYFNDSAGVPSIYPLTLHGTCENLNHTTKQSCLSDINCNGGGGTCVWTSPIVADTVTLTAVDNDTGNEIPVVQNYGITQTPTDAPAVVLTSDIPFFIYDADTGQASPSAGGLGQTITFALTHNLYSVSSIVWTLSWSNTYEEIITAGSSSNWSGFDLADPPVSATVSPNYFNQLVNNNPTATYFKVNVKVITEDAQGSFTDFVDEITITRLFIGGGYSIILSNELDGVYADADGNTDPATAVASTTVFLYKGAVLRNTFIKITDTAGTIPSLIEDNSTDSPDITSYLESNEFSNIVSIKVFDSETCSEHNAGATCSASAYNLDELAGACSDATSLNKEDCEGLGYTWFSYYIGEASFTFFKTLQGESAQGFLIIPDTQIILFDSSGTEALNPETLVHTQHSNIQISNHEDIEWILYTEDYLDETGGGEETHNDNFDSGTYLRIETEAGVPLDPGSISFRSAAYFEAAGPGETHTSVKIYAEVVNQPDFHDRVTFHKIEQTAHGEDAQTISLSSSIQTVLFNNGELATPDGNIILITSPSNIDTPVYDWTIKVNGEECVDCAFDVGGDGNALSEILFSNFATMAPPSGDPLSYITVTVEVNDLEDSISIIKLDTNLGVSGYLTNEAHIVQAASTGVVSNFTGAGGSFETFYGTTSTTASTIFAGGMCYDDEGFGTLEGGDYGGQVTTIQYVCEEVLSKFWQDDPEFSTGTADIYLITGSCSVPEYTSKDDCASGAGVWTYDQVQAGNSNYDVSFVDAAAYTFTQTFRGYVPVLGSDRLVNSSQNNWILTGASGTWDTINGTWDQHGNGNLQLTSGNSYNQINYKFPSSWYSNNLLEEDGIYTLTIVLELLIQGSESPILDVHFGTTASTIDTILLDPTGQGNTYMPGSNIVVQTVLQYLVKVGKEPTGIPQLILKVDNDDTQMQISKITLEKVTIFDKIYSLSKSIDGSNATLLTLTADSQTFIHNPDSDTYSVGQIITFLISGSNLEGAVDVQCLTDPLLNLDLNGIENPPNNQIDLVEGLASFTLDVDDFAVHAGHCDDGVCSNALDNNYWDCEAAAATWIESATPALCATAVANWVYSTSIRVVHESAGVQDTFTVHRLSDGTAGNDAIVGYLTNEMHTVPAASDGIVIEGLSVDSSTGVFKVFDGIDNVTLSSVFALGPGYSLPYLTNQNGLDFRIGFCSDPIHTDKNACETDIDCNGGGFACEWNPGEYVVSETGSGTWDTLLETFTLRATYGGIDLEKIFTITKTVQGATALVAQLTNESHVFPSATDDGTVDEIDTNLGSTEVLVLEGDIRFTYNINPTPGTYYISDGNNHETPITTGNTVVGTNINSTLSIPVADAKFTPNWNLVDNEGGGTSGSLIFGSTADSASLTINLEITTSNNTLVSYPVVATYAVTGIGAEGDPGSDAKSLQLVNIPNIITGDNVIPPNLVPNYQVILYDLQSNGFEEAKGCSDTQFTDPASCEPNDWGWPINNIRWSLQGSGLLNTARGLADGTGVNINVMGAAGICTELEYITQYDCSNAGEIWTAVTEFFAYGTCGNCSNTFYDNSSDCEENNAAWYVLPYLDDVTREGTISGGQCSDGTLGAWIDTENECAAEGGTWKGDIYNCTDNRYNLGAGNADGHWESSWNYNTGLFTGLNPTIYLATSTLEGVCNDGGTSTQNSWDNKDECLCDAGGTWLGETTDDGCSSGDSPTGNNWNPAINNFYTLFKPIGGVRYFTVKAEIPTNILDPGDGSAFNDIATVTLLTDPLDGLSPSFITVSADEQAFVFEDENATEPESAFITLTIRQFSQIDEVDPELGSGVGIFTYTNATLTNFYEVEHTVNQDGTHSGVYTLHINYISIGNFPITFTVTNNEVSDSITLIKLQGGTNAVTGYLTNETFTVSVDSFGIPLSPFSCEGFFKIYEGLVDVTSSGMVGTCVDPDFDTYATCIVTSTWNSGYSFSASGNSDLDFDTNPAGGDFGKYTITNLSDDNVVIDFSAIYKGTTIDKTFNIVKAYSAPEHYFTTLSNPVDFVYTDYAGVTQPVDVAHIFTEAESYRGVEKLEEWTANNVTSDGSQVARRISSSPGFIDSNDGQLVMATTPSVPTISTTVAPDSMTTDLGFIEIESIYPKGGAFPLGTLLNTNEIHNTIPEDYFSLITFVDLTLAEHIPDYEDADSYIYVYDSNNVLQKLHLEDDPSAVNIDGTTVTFSVNGADWIGDGGLGDGFVRRVIFPNLTLLEETTQLIVTKVRAGINAWTVLLDNETHTFNVNSAGVQTSSDASCSVQIFHGSENDLSNWVYLWETADNITFSTETTEDLTSIAIGAGFISGIITLTIEHDYLGGCEDPLHETQGLCEGDVDCNGGGFACVWTPFTLTKVMSINTTISPGSLTISGPQFFKVLNDEAGTIETDPLVLSWNQEDQESQITINDFEIIDAENTIYNYSSDGTPTELALSVDALGSSKGTINLYHDAEMVYPILLTVANEGLSDSIGIAELNDGTDGTDGEPAVTILGDNLSMLFPLLNGNAVEGAEQECSFHVYLGAGLLTDLENWSMTLSQISQESNLIYNDTSGTCWDDVNGVEVPAWIDDKTSCESNSYVWKAWLVHSGVDKFVLKDVQWGNGTILTDTNLSSFVNNDLEGGFYDATPHGGFIGYGWEAAGDEATVWSEEVVNTHSEESTKAQRITRTTDYDKTGIHQNITLIENTVYKFTGYIYVDRKTTSSLWVDFGNGNEFWFTPNGNTETTDASCSVSVPTRLSMGMGQQTEFAWNYLVGYFKSPVTVTDQNISIHRGSGDAEPDDYIIIDDLKITYETLTQDNSVFKTLGITLTNTDTSDEYTSLITATASNSSALVSISGPQIFSFDDYTDTSPVPDRLELYWYQSNQIAEITKDNFSIIDSSSQIYTPGTEFWELGGQSYCEADIDTCKQGNIEHSFSSNGLDGNMWGTITIPWSHFLFPIVVKFEGENASIVDSLDLHTLFGGSDSLPAAQIIATYNDYQDDQNGMGTPGDYTITNIDDPLSGFTNEPAEISGSEGAGGYIILWFKGSDDIDRSGYYPQLVPGDTITIYVTSDEHYTFEVREAVEDLGAAQKFAIPVFAISGLHNYTTGDFLPDSGTIEIRFSRVPAGESALIGNLTNEVHLVPAGACTIPEYTNDVDCALNAGVWDNLTINADSNSWDGSGGVFDIWYGLTKVNSSASYTVKEDVSEAYVWVTDIDDYNSSGIDFTIDQDGNYEVTKATSEWNASSNVQVFTLKAEYTTDNAQLLSMEKSFSITKSIAGLPGTDGTNGADGEGSKTVSLTSDTYIISFNADGTTPSPNGVFDLTATSQGFDNPVFQFTGDGIDDEESYSSGTLAVDTHEFDPSGLTYFSPYTLQVQVAEAAASTVQVALDSISIYAVKPGVDGSDAYTIVLTNEVHTVPVDANGDATYTGTGTDFIAYKGTTQLHGVTGTSCTAGQFCISKFEDNHWTWPDITPVSVDTDNLRIGDHDVMTNITADCTYTILLEGLVTVIKTQTFNKTTDGSDGAPAAALTITSSSQVFVFDDSSDTTPSPPNVTITGTQSNQENTLQTGNLTSALADITNFDNSNASDGTGYSTWTVTPNGSGSYPIVCILDNDGLQDTISLHKITGGADGDSAVVSLLTNESFTAPADSNGIATVFNGGFGNMKIFEGAAEDTDNWTWVAETLTNGSGLQCTVAADGFYSLGGTWNASTNSETFTITATKATYSDQIKDFSVSKSIAGADASSIVALLSNPTHTVSVDSNGSNGNYDNPVAGGSFIVSLGNQDLVDMGGQITFTRTGQSGFCEEGGLGGQIGFSHVYAWDCGDQGGTWTDHTTGGTIDVDSGVYSISSIIDGSEQGIVRFNASFDVQDIADIYRDFVVTKVFSGYDAYSYTLTNEFHQFPADENGVVDATDLTAGDFEVEVWRGLTRLTYDEDDTQLNTFKIDGTTVETGIDVTLTGNGNGGNALYDVTNVSLLSGSVTLTITDNDTVDSTPVTFDLVYTFARADAPLAGESAYAVYLTNEFHTFPANATGTVDGSDFAAGAFETRLYKGDTQYTWNNTPGENQYKISTNLDYLTFSSALSGDDLLFTPNTFTPNELSGYVDVTFEIANGLTFTRRYSWNISPVPADFTLALTTTPQHVLFEEGALFVSPLPTHIIAANVEGNPPNSNDLYYKFNHDAQVQGTFDGVVAGGNNGSTSAIVTYNSGVAWIGAYPYQIRCQLLDGSGGTVLATDYISIHASVPTAEPQTVTGTCSTTSIVYDQFGNIPSPNTITCYATAQGFNNPYFRWTGDGIADDTYYANGTSGVSSDISPSFTVPSTNTGFPKTLRVGVTDEWAKNCMKDDPYNIETPSATGFVYADEQACLDAYAGGNGTSGTCAGGPYDGQSGLNSVLQNLCEAEGVWTTYYTWVERAFDVFSLVSIEPGSDVAAVHLDVSPAIIEFNSIGAPLIPNISLYLTATTLFNNPSEDNKFVFEWSENAGVSWSEISNGASASVTWNNGLLELPFPAFIIRCQLLGASSGTLLAQDIVPITASTELGNPALVSIELNTNVVQFEHPTSDNPLPSTIEVTVTVVNILDQLVNADITAPSGFNAGADIDVSNIYIANGLYNGYATRSFSASQDQDDYPGTFTISNAGGNDWAPGIPSLTDQATVVGIHSPVDGEHGLALYYLYHVNTITDATALEAALTSEGFPNSGSFINVNDHWTTDIPTSLTDGQAIWRSYVAISAELQSPDCSSAVPDECELFSDPMIVAYHGVDAVDAYTSVISSSDGEVFKYEYNTVASEGGSGTDINKWETHANTNLEEGDLSTLAIEDNNFKFTLNGDTGVYNLTALGPFANDGLCTNSTFTNKPDCETAFEVWHPGIGIDNNEGSGEDLPIHESYIKRKFEWTHNTSHVRIKFRIIFVGLNSYDRIKIKYNIGGTDFDSGGTNVYDTSDDASGLRNALISDTISSSEIEANWIEEPDLVNIPLSHNEITTPGWCYAGNNTSLPQFINQSDCENGGGNWNSGTTSYDGIQVIWNGELLGFPEAEGEAPSSAYTAGTGHSYIAEIDTGWISTGAIKHATLKIELDINDFHNWQKECFGLYDITCKTRTLTPASTTLTATMYKGGNALGNVTYNWGTPDGLTAISTVTAQDLVILPEYIENGIRQISVTTADNDSSASQYITTEILDLTDSVPNHVGIVKIETLNGYLFHYADANSTPDPAHITLVAKMYDLFDGSEVPTDYLTFGWASKIPGASWVSLPDTTQSIVITAADVDVIKQYKVLITVSVQFPYLANLQAYDSITISDITDGVQGVQGVSLNYKGEWEDDTFYAHDIDTYFIVDVVSVGGTFYKCNNEHTSDSGGIPLYQSPPNGSDSWDPLTSFSNVATDLLFAVDAFVHTRLTIGPPQGNWTDDPSAVNTSFNRPALVVNHGNTGIDGTGIPTKFQDLDNLGGATILDQTIIGFDPNAGNGACSELDGSCSDEQYDTREACEGDTDCNGTGLSCIWTEYIFTTADDCEANEGVWTGGKSHLARRGHAYGIKVMERWITGYPLGCFDDASHPSTTGIGKAGNCSGSGEEETEQACCEENGGIWEEDACDGNETETWTPPLAQNITGENYSETGCPGNAVFYKSDGTSITNYPERVPTGSGDYGARRLVYSFSPEQVYPGGHVYREKPDAAPNTSDPTWSGGIRTIFQTSFNDASGMACGENPYLLSSQPGWCNDNGNNNPSAYYDQSTCVDASSTWYLDARPMQYVGDNGGENLGWDGGGGEGENVFGTCLQDVGQFGPVYFSVANSLEPYWISTAEECCIVKEQGSWDEATAWCDGDGPSNGSWLGCHNIDSGNSVWPDVVENQYLGFQWYINPASTYWMPYSLFEKTIDWENMNGTDGINGSGFFDRFTNNNLFGLEGGEKKRAVWHLVVFMYNSDDPKSLAMWDAEVAYSKGFISTLMNPSLGTTELGGILENSAHMYSLKNLENNVGRCENENSENQFECEADTCVDANGDRPCRWYKWGRYEHFIPSGVDITNLRFFAALTSIHPSGNDQGGMWLPVRGFLEIWEVDETDYYDDSDNDRKGIL